MVLILMKRKSKKRSTPRMGGTRNKMYKYKPGEQPSVPAMGSRGDGKGSNAFAPLGSLFEPITKLNQYAKDKNKSFAQSKPGMHLVGKGKWKFDNPEDEQQRTEELSSLQKSIFSTPRMGPKMIQTATGTLNRSRRVSVPRMGPIGAIGGAYSGKKLGSWIGSAGKLINPTHEKYGRKAGEYIGGSVGGVFGGLLAPI